MESLLEVGSSLEDEADHEAQKRVFVRLKRIKVYEGLKLGFLEIMDIARYQAANSKLTSSCNSRIPLFLTKEIMPVENGRTPKKKRTQDFSINL